MKYIPFVFIIFIMSIIACEQVVDIEIPEHESQLVLSSFYNVGETKVTAGLTKSLAISSSEDADDVWGATVKFYENDLLLGQLEDTEDTLYRNIYAGMDSLGNIIFEPTIWDIRRTYKLELSAPLEANKTYKIIAEAPSFATATATQQLPELSNIIGITYEPMSRPGAEGYVMDALNIELQDVEGQDSYYELAVYTQYQDYSNKEWTESLTPGIERGYRGVSLLKDDLFENSSYNVELLIYPTDTSNADIIIEINSISRDKYLFSKSLNAYDNALYNPFAEPVIVHTNVEDGQGIFSMENKTEILIE